MSKIWFERNFKQLNSFSLLGTVISVYNNKFDNI